MQVISSVKDASPVSPSASNKGKRILSDPSEQRKHCRQTCSNKKFGGDLRIKHLDAAFKHTVIILSAEKTVFSNRT